MLTRRSAFLGTIALTIWAAMPVAAHDAPRVETEITQSENHTLEIVHVLQLSSAQRLLHKAGIIKTNDITGLQARARAAIYSADRFDLYADNKKLPLEILGAEIEGGHLYIYQTSSLQTLPKNWSARNAILRDLSPRFDNIVNVPTADGVRTIVFGGTEIDAINSSN